MILLQLYYITTDTLNEANLSLWIFRIRIIEHILKNVSENGSECGWMIGSIKDKSATKSFRLQDDKLNDTAKPVVMIID